MKHLPSGLLRDATAELRGRRCVQVYVRRLKVARYELHLGKVRLRS